MNTYEEWEIRNRLKGEIDRIPRAQLKNLSRSKNSFFSWVKRTAQRIWGVVKGIGNVAGWLWDHVIVESEKKWGRFRRDQFFMGDRDQ